MSNAERFPTAVDRTLTAPRRRALAHADSVAQDVEASPTAKRNPAGLSTAAPSLPRLASRA